MRIGGLALTAAAAICVFGTGVAGAAPPEWGRCVLAPGGKTGEYKGANCTVKAAGNGAYNWAPEPQGKAKFAGFGLKVSLETPAKQRIVCLQSDFDGSYTGPKTATVKLTLVGCDLERTKVLCSSNPLKEGEIEGELEGELGFIKTGEKPIVGIDLKPKSPSTTFASFVCGKLPEVQLSGTIEGSAIGSVKPLNHMKPEFLSVFKVVAGVQSPQSFEGGAKDTLTATLLEGLTTSKEEIGLRQTVEYENEELETTEIKAK
jgi:hypothetical protein